MRIDCMLAVNITRISLPALFFLVATWSPAMSQMYYPEEYYYQNQYPGAQDYEQPPVPVQPPGPGNRRRQPFQASNQQPAANLQYDARDAEMILRDQVNQGQYGPPEDQQAQSRYYDNYYGHRISQEDQLQRVMTDARQIGGMVGNRNSKPYVVIDKRNFQYYLFNKSGRLLRIGPVAIGKGKTHVGAFETPVGVFPIKSKIPVDDWIRPDWYFIEEREPVPKRWEDRRVPGFFRYKLVFDGTRYIHYAEATGGRLTHGCLGLDWEDAEAVFHTLQVGSYCIIVDSGFLSRLARGEFPVKTPAPVAATQSPAKPDKPEAPPATITAQVDSNRTPAMEQPSRGGPDRAPFQSLW